MPAAGDKDAFRIGPRLRAIRLDQGLSLRAVAARTGFSASFLSQVELGQVSPSLGSLDRIASSLGASLAGLLSQTRDVPGPILRRKGAPGLRSEWSRATAQSLLPAGTDDSVAAVLIALEPDGRTGKAAGSPAGQELAFCVRGKATLELGAERFTLGQGDSIFYDASLSGVWRNESVRPAEILLLTLRKPRPARKGR